MKRVSIPLLVLSAVAASSPARAQAPAARKAATPVTLAVSPAAEPSPSLRYPLLPSSARLNPGDAAPIILRLRYEVKEQEWDALAREPARWLQLPIRELPLAEAKALVDARSRQLDLLAIAARRATCDWAYPLEEQRVDVVEIALGDVQSLRNWARLLAVKARVEIAEGRFDDAARSMETGFAFARQVGSSPFAIGGLVGVALGSINLDRVEDWIGAPGSPNLYWSLTALPQPFVSLREALEQERLIAENMVPELVDGAEPATAAGWARRLETMDGRLRKLAGRVSFGGGPGGPTEEEKRLKAAIGTDLAAYKRMHLTTLRERVVESGGFPAVRIRDMSEDEVAARGLVLGYRTLWDRLFRTMYLPFLEARERQGEYEKAVEGAKDGPFAALVMLHPSIYPVQKAEARLPRRVALLRVVEAIRIHAAGHGGALPKSLDDVKEVPIPADPATGRPFSLELEGDAAVLTAPEVPDLFTPEYRITIRKP
ncbi:hypothetical protein [Paludisphaera mucosa]|uniref:Uncharacterized protein n=1 Tax=Paludisphaera mucosa TaxID=3030827 RepID=A0ABT6FBT4_9BACT|nr:hypothetical protein [Paludisphaera mucosa]MDG3005047.1 hypothetical protein [Paludisphaera mucosa]